MVCGRLAGEIAAGKAEMDEVEIMSCSKCALKRRTKRDVSGGFADPVQEVY